MLKNMILCVVFIVSGCSESYIIKHQAAGTAAMVAVDGSIRTLMVNKEGRFCAEPPPDAIGTIAKAIAAKATVESDPLKSKGSGEYRRTFESEIHDLFQRSQGVQVLRDGMFRLCEAFVNGAIDKGVYAEQMIDLISTLDFVVPMELCVKISEEIRKEELPGQKSTSASSQMTGEAEQSKKQEKAPLTLTSFHRKPIDNLMATCFKTAYTFAFDHNQATVRRAEVNRDIQKAVLLEQIVSTR